MTAIRAYGMHLMIDAYDADPARLADVGFIFRVLDELPALLGMRKIGPPQMARFTQPGIAGVSGVVMIVESHISLHTYVGQRFFSMDAYSCKPFDHDMVSRLMRERFGTDDLDIQLADRGRRFPVLTVSSEEPQWKHEPIS